MIEGATVYPYNFDAGTTASIVCKDGFRFNGEQPGCDATGDLIGAVPTCRECGEQSIDWRLRRNFCGISAVVRDLWIVFGISLIRLVTSLPQIQEAAQILACGHKDK